MDYEEWEEKTRLVNLYRDKHGPPCNMPLDWKCKDGTALGAWVAAQRREYAAFEVDPSSSSLTKARHEYLGLIGVMKPCEIQTGGIGELAHPAPEGEAAEEEDEVTVKTESGEEDGGEGRSSSVSASSGELVPLALL